MKPSISKQTLSQMHTRALSAMRNAYAPISHFHVGACVLSESGKLYSGCNVESITLTLTTHAEMNVIDTMVASGERKISAILIITPSGGIPCALCRQKIAEFSDNALVIESTIDGKTKEFRISELYPQAFTKL